MSSKHFLSENNKLLEKAKSKAKLCQSQGKKFSGKLGSKDIFPDIKLEIQNSLFVTENFVES